MEETKQINSLDVVEEEAQTGIIEVNEYFNTPIDPAKMAERVELTKSLLISLTKIVSPCNITDFGGKPYFDHLACERMERFCGLHSKLNEDEAGNIAFRKIIEDASINKYTIYITGRIYNPKGREQDYLIEEGSSNSFDDWFSAYQNVDWEEYTDKDGNKRKRKVVLNANALPESKVREKARANLRQRLLKKYLGLDFTWEELEKAGIDRTKCKGFTFNGSGATADSKEINDLRQEIWKKIVEMVGGDVEKAKAKLKEHTSFGDFAGYTDINKVKEKPLEILKGKVDKFYNSYLKKLNSEGSADVENE